MVGVIVAKDALLLHKSEVCLATGQYSSCTEASFTAQSGGPTAMVLRAGTGEPQMGDVKSSSGELLVIWTPAESALER